MRDLVSKIRNLVSKWERGGEAYYLFQRGHYRYELERCINGHWLLVQRFDMPLGQVNLRLSETYRLVCEFGQ